MKRALSVLVVLVVGALIGSVTTLGVQHLRHEDEVLRGLAYGGSGPADAEVGKPYTLDGGSVCVTGSFSRITAIRPRNPQGGIKVTGFKLVDTPDSNRRTDAVTTRCKDGSDDGQRLFVTVTAEELPAAADGYLIDYTIDGRSATTTTENWALLCDPAMKDDVVHYGDGDITPKCFE